jgi:hypothetical protein
MERVDEIQILIEHLKADVKKTANNYPSLLSDTIIKNGKLIEAYKEELEQLKQITENR